MSKITETELKRLIGKDFYFLLDHQIKKAPCEGYEIENSGAHRKVYLFIAYKRTKRQYRPIKVQFNFCFSTKQELLEYIR